MLNHDYRLAGCDFSGLKTKVIRLNVLPGFVREGQEELTSLNAVGLLA